MSQETSDSLIQKFFNNAQSNLSNISIKFKADGDKFEVELSGQSMGMQEIRLLVDDMIHYSIVENSRNKSSAK